MPWSVRPRHRGRWRDVLNIVTALVTASIWALPLAAQDLANFQDLFAAAQRWQHPARADQVVLYLAAGVFDVTDALVFDSNSQRIPGSFGNSVSIIGKGPDATFLDCGNRTTIKSALQFINVDNVAVQNLTIRNCINTLDGTVEDVGGAAVSIQSAAQVYIYGSAFTGNLATGNNSSGGAVKIRGIAAVSNDTYANITVTNNVFTDNHADLHGGALMYDGIMETAVSTIVFFQVIDCSFQGNSAGDTGGAMHISNMTGGIRFTRVDIIKNTALLEDAGGGGVMIRNCRTDAVLLWGCLFKDNSVPKGYGAGVLVDDLVGLLTLNQTAFLNNFALKAGGGMYVQNLTSNVMLDSCTFQSGLAAGDGAALYIYKVFAPVNVDRSLLKGAVTFHNTTFTNMNAVYNGTGIPEQYWRTTSIIYMNAVFGAVTFDHSNFTDNYAWSSRDASWSYAYVLNLFAISKSVEIDNCFFHNNFAAGAVVAIETASQVLIHNCSWTSNQKSAITLRSSDTIILNSVFDSNLGWAGGAVWAFYSQLEIHACRFYNNMAGFGGAICAMDGTRLHIDPGYFYDGDYGWQGSTGNMYYNWLTKANEYANPGGEAETWRPSSFVNNTAISGGAIQTVGSNLKISNPFPDMNIDYAMNTSFINNRALTGGAIAARLGIVTDNYALCYMLLHGNEAVGLASLPPIPNRNDSYVDRASIALSYGMGVGNGGGIAAIFQADAEPGIVQSTFQLNAAEGYGGALYLGSSADTCPGGDNCFWLTLWNFDVAPNISTAVNMTSNSARRGAGGAIYYEGKASLEVWCDGSNLSNGNQPCPWWVNNTAPVGPTLASSPMYANVTPTYIGNYTSGADVNVTFTLWDVYNQRHNPPQPNPRRTDVVSFQVDDPMASGQMTIKVGGPNGNLSSLHGLRVRDQPGNHNLTIVAVVEELRRRLPDLSVTFGVRSCVLGEVSQANATLCYWCDAGQYSVTPNVNEASCQQCPDNAYCNQPQGTVSGIITPQDGYWNSNPFSEQVYQCPNSNSCKFANRSDILAAYQDTLRSDPSKYNQQEYYDIMCDEGYTGHFCAECTPGHGPAGSAKCVHCRSRGLSIFLYVLITLVSLVPFFVATQTAISTATKVFAQVKTATTAGRNAEEGKVAVEEEEEEEDAFETPTSIVKVTLSYLQVIALMRFIVLPEYPSSFYTTLEVAQTMSQFPGTAVALSCTLPDEMPISKAMAAVILALTLPLASEISVALFLLVLQWLTFVKQKAAKSATIVLSSSGWMAKNSRSVVADNPPKAARPALPFFYKIVLILLAGTFAFYEHLLTTFLNILACASGDEDNHDNTLAHQAGLLTGLWWQMDYAQQCYEGIHALLAYLIAIPGIAVFALGCPLWTCWYLCHNAHLLEEPEFKAMWGFLYSEYQARLFAWEAVIMLRKLSISMLIVLLGTSTDNAGLQLFAGIAIMALALTAHLAFEPYKEQLVSRLETLSLTITLISLYLSSYYTIPNATEAYIVIPWIVILLNGATMVILFWSIYRAFRDSLLSKLGIASSFNGANGFDQPPDGLRGLDTLSTNLSGATSIPLSSRERLLSIQQQLEPKLGMFSRPTSHVLHGLAAARDLENKTGRMLHKTASQASRTMRKVLHWEVAHNQLKSTRRLLSTQLSGSVTSLQTPLETPKETLKEPFAAVPEGDGSYCGVAEITLSPFEFESNQVLTKRISRPNESTVAATAAAEQRPLSTRVSRLNETAAAAAAADEQRGTLSTRNSCLSEAAVAAALSGSPLRAGLPNAKRHPTPSKGRTD